MNRIVRMFSGGPSIHNRRPRSTSCIKDDLDDDEKFFLTSVRLGDLETTKLIIQTKNIDQNCCDYSGQRALDIAVDNKDLELITFLLGNISITPTHYYGAILRAVFNDSTNILEILLERAKSDKELYFKLQDLMSGSSESTKYIPEVAVTNLTPVMAAAIKGNLEITRMLLKQGYYIKKPHSPKCSCNKSCEIKAQDGETLAESINRMNTYRALASSTYLLLTCPDPILSAFELSLEMKQLSNELPENQKEYLELSKQCSKFAADILSQCRNTTEVQSVLIQRRGFSDPRPHKFSRLHLAVQYRQKEFVTHPSCQQVLRSLWVESQGSWYSWSYGRQAVHVIKHVLLTPIIVLGFVFIPRSEIVGPLRVPLHRFIYSATCYLFFLSLLVVTLYKHRKSDDTSLEPTEIAVGLFILGHSWEIITSVISKGFSNYFRSSWSMYDLIMFSMFFMTQILWFGVYLFCEYGSTATDRMSWKWYNPILIGEGLYACASIMAFTRLLVWFQVNSRLGPLGTSIRYMIVDVVRFLMLLFIIMLAFATGLYSMYKNYTPGGFVPQQSLGFQTLLKTFKTLFWAMFGMGRPEFASVVAKNCTEEMHSMNQTEHWFTEGVGYTLWGLYHMITVVILVNMVIAMMTESYQRVQTNADMEWKFACSTLWLTVIDNHCAVPPPFNLIPSMHRITRFFHFVRERRAGSRRIGWSLKGCFYWESEVDSSAKKFEEDRYEKLMVQLIRRYLNFKSRQLEETNSPHLDSGFKEKLKEEILQELHKALKTERSFRNEKYKDSSEDAQNKEREIPKTL